MRVYYDRDADVNLIKGKKVAVIGYGSQGHAHVLNMRDSGVKEIAVALRPGSASAAKAEAEGIKVLDVPEAAKWADVMMMVTPDELQGDIYRDHLHANMKKGAALLFAHGLNVHFNLIEPRKDLDVLMVAPKGPGHTVRGEYLKGGGVPCLIAVHQNPSGNALAKVGAGGDSVLLCALIISAHMIGMLSKSTALTACQLCGGTVQRRSKVGIEFFRYWSMCSCRSPMNGRAHLQEVFHVRTCHSRRLTAEPLAILGRRLRLPQALRQLLVVLEEPRELRILQVSCS